MVAPYRTKEKQKEMESNSQQRGTTIKLRHIAVAVAAGLIATSCANMGSGPQGGLKDYSAPKYVGSTPAPNEKNYNNKKITISFDEYIQLSDAYNKVVVSPPQENPFSVSSLGKKVTVELEDSLIPDRTYIIDFGNSIIDNNEGNAINDYFISFSTGNTVDSFAISGKLVDAHTLAPVQGVYVGAYESDADSVFKKHKMDYVAKTDSKGIFKIRGLKEREYSIYALKDVNSNYKYDDKTEGIAVLGSRVKTSRIEQTKRDTVYKDSTTIDTIKTRKVSLFKPDSLVLRFYKEIKHLQYFKNAAWKEKEQIVLSFVNEKKQLPTITPLNFKSKDWYRIGTGVTFDTLTYWITDTLVAQMDTIRFAIDYEKTDSMERFVPKRDTIQLYAKKWKREKKYKGPEFEMKRQVEIYAKPKLKWKTPVMALSKEQVKVQEKADTLWKEIEFDIQPVANAPREYEINMAFEPEKLYRIRIDSGMVRDLSGFANKERLETQFKFKKKSDYSNLELTIKNAAMPAFAELLNGSEAVIRTVPVNGGKIRFENLDPSDYYIRLTEDTNNDGKWTTGDYDSKTEPENTYYYPEKITLRANWDREEDWDIKSKRQADQRPAGLNNKDKKK